ncbi:hypothetical protein ACFV0D_12495 [Streptomyces sp. NPDC059556]|uniref:hypothetical protein n=1 Tax=Streptomyces sp. NPDC059556 TaxID=3346863 RepID=UPI003685C3FC
MSRPDPVLTAAVAAIDDRLSQLAAAIKNMVIAECLTTTTLQFNAQGYAEFDYAVRFASVAVTNLSAAPVTVTTQTPAEAAPVTGTGVAIVPANSGAAYNLSGHSLTLYGTAGDRVTVSVFSRPSTPAWG